MYRIIIILILLMLLYFLIRSAVRALQERGKTVGQNQLSDKQMVQDPVCRVFVPKGTAVQEEIGGQNYFFCSRECAKTFQRQLGG
ncbi:MAG: YHS domain-containing protein [Nitrospiraceae bacterium]